MTGLSGQVDWDKGEGLVPAIVQDVKTGKVLMLGYMNPESLARTEQSGKVTFYSRTRQSLWVKGETSGHFLIVKDIRIDCDNDTLLIQAEPQGPTCHTGAETCFGGFGSDLGFLGTLENIIEQRTKANIEDSYVARLLHGPIEKAAQKVGEEGVETALAAVCSPQDRLTEEAADLVFHMMVLLKASGFSLRDVVSVLEKRHAAQKK